MHTVLFLSLDGLCRSVSGQQFVIEACVVSCKDAKLTVQTKAYSPLTRQSMTCLQDCQLYVFDVSATISVEDCTDCRILLGPVDGRC